MRALPEAARIFLRRSYAREITSSHKRERISLELTEACASLSLRLSALELV